METRKKGFTLIEVTVALAILTLVLAAMVQLVVNVINLAMLTRDKTEAVALSQKGLTDGISAIQNCQTSATIPPIVINGKTLTVTYNNSFAAITATPATTVPLVGTPAGDDFVRVTSTVTWTARGNNYTVTDSQYVKEPN